MHPIGYHQHLAHPTTLSGHQSRWNLVSRYNLSLDLLLFNPRQVHVIVYYIKQNLLPQKLPLRFQATCANHFTTILSSQNILEYSPNLFRLFHQISNFPEHGYQLSFLKPVVIYHKLYHGFQVTPHNLQLTCCIQNIQ